MSYNQWTSEWWVKYLHVQCAWPLFDISEEEEEEEKASQSKSFYRVCSRVFVLVGFCCINKHNINMADSTHSCTYDNFSLTRSGKKIISTKRKGFCNQWNENKTKKGRKKEKVIDKSQVKTLTNIHTKRQWVKRRTSEKCVLQVTSLILFNGHKYNNNNHNKWLKCQCKHTRMMTTIKVRIVYLKKSQNKRNKKELTTTYRGWTEEYRQPNQHIQSVWSNEH